MPVTWPKIYAGSPEQVKPAENQNYHAMSKIVQFMFKLEKIAAIASYFYAVKITPNFTIVLSHMWTVYLSSNELVNKSDIMK